VGNARNHLEVRGGVFVQIAHKDFHISLYCNSEIYFMFNYL
jgi:hypothetical protein